MDAVANFTRAFDFNNPAAVNTGVAFLIVCDMLLTGFDAPVEQVMYIDKKVKDHNLLQTIARVNRVAKGKSRGYIVDYIGLANHLSKALSIYAAEDQADIKVSLKDLSAEIPILEDRYRRLLNLFINNGVGQIREFVEQTLRKENETQAVLEQAVSLLVDVKLRTTFEVCLNKFLQSLDIVLPNSAATPYRVPTKRFGYILAKVKERYKDESLDISRAGEKVRKIIDEHLISLGINPKIPPVELLSPSFIHEVQKNTSSKAKASEMEHAIRKHCKVEFNKDPTLYTKLSEKLEALIKKYKDNWDELYKQLFDLRKEVEVGREKLPDGVSPKAAPFYDRIGQLAFGNDGVPAKYDHIVKDLVEGIIEKLQNTIDIINFWSNAPEISRLRGALSDLILLSKVPELIDRCESLVNEITDLAKARHRDIVK